MSDIPSKSELMANIERGWNDLQAYITSLTPAQMTEPTDAAGWTVKDHLMHLAVWEGGMVELLHRRPRWEYMGLPPESAGNRDFDAMNAVIQKAHKNKSLDEVLAALRTAHQQMLDTLQPLTDADLQRSYSDY
ncbi:MAG: DinB family protein, partial [Anaerolineae bacterium]|nr:DinB family protein [Anaerolineae bacterium]